MHNADVYILFTRSVNVFSAEKEPLYMYKPNSLDIMPHFLLIRISYKYEGGLIMEYFRLYACEGITAMAELPITVSCGLR